MALTALFPVSATKMVVADTATELGLEKPLASVDTAPPGVIAFIAA
jgi:hypothetical protein